MKVKTSAKSLDTTANLIKQTSFEMDKMLEDYAKKTKKLVSGNFSRGDTVAILSPEGREIARGLVAYDAADAVRIAGLKTAEIETVTWPLSVPPVPPDRT